MCSPAVLPLYNPFGAPVYYKERVNSTMDEARALAAGTPGAAGAVAENAGTAAESAGAAAKNGAPHGTVIAADCQTAGRGRSGRPWLMKAGENLSFTVILRYSGPAGIPPCLPLRAGLALSYAVEDFCPALRGLVKIKWPNDLMLIHKDGPGRKAAGILAEASGGTVYLGMGINVAQTAFPPELAGKAVSIAGTLAGYATTAAASGGSGGRAVDPAALTEQRFALLERILARLHTELESAAGTDWRKALEERLYLKGRRVVFVPGAADTGTDPAESSGGGPRIVEGILRGVGEDGALLIDTEDGNSGGAGSPLLSFVNGELRVY